MKNVLRASLAAVLAYAVLPRAAPQPSAASKTFREGVFTAEQASRGEQVYAGKCSACHGENLLGIEMAPALAGPNFRASWDKQPLLTLANRIKTTMPPFAPNSLSTNQITDLLSYILKANDVRAGNVALSLPISDMHRRLLLPSRKRKASGPPTELIWRARGTRRWTKSTRITSANFRSPGG